MRRHRYGIDDMVNDLSTGFVYGVVTVLVFLGLGILALFALLVF